MPLPHSYMPSIPQLPQPRMAKPARRRERPKERWLLTRKTWKYMSDAGRRLIPEGSHNRPEDIPKIEAYFQDVCQREPRFLLWRKSSYPGAIPKPRKKRVRGGSVRARSPDDAPIRPTDLMLHTSGGRFDMAKMRRDFFAPSGTLPPFSSEPAIIPPSSTPVDDDESTLVDLLRKYLKVEDASGPTKITDQDELVKTLRRYLKKQSEADSDGDRSGDRPRDSTQRSLLENLSRYYCRSPNRDNIVQDLLTDRNLLKRLYHDLRKTRPYRGRGYTPYTSTPGPSSYISGRNLRNYDFIKRVQDGGDPLNFRTSPPPLIEVSHESLEDKYVDCGTQTLPIPEEVLLELEQAYRDKLEAQSPTSPTSPTSPSSGKPARRRSSVDHDDVSQSVSDTIKRYLRMARKKSVDAEKPDRFKRINYDKNLRNIKPKPYNDVDDDGPHKGCQTDEAWILTYRDLSFSSLASSPTSPPPSPLPGSTHGFLSSLLGRSTPTFASAGGIQNANVPAGGMHKSLSVNTVSMDGPGGMQTAGGMQSGAGGMQKSRSTSSVVSSVSKRLWRTRSRSSSRVSASWMPQGSCCWADGAGRCVRLTSTSLLALSEIERRALQQAALARLQQFNIGTPVRIPEDCTLPASKPKRRAYLLKRKALTTGIFDQRTTKDGDKNKEPPGTFGVPLAQCVDTERALRLQRGSRASLASLAALDKDDSESCDSGDWTGSSVEEGGPRVPALVTSCLGHLRRHGMRTLGLFRVSASKKRVRQLREEWEQVQEAALDSAVCPHDVATLLKEFLRDLPDPLLCRDLYPAFLHTQKIRNRRLQWEALKLIVQLLPTAHRDTLNAILSFLAELASHAEDGREPGNKMDAANLATVFAPTILHRNKPDETVSVEQLSERADVINVVRQLIERQAELWALPAELLHEAYIHLAHTAPAHLDALLPRRVECVVQKAMATDGRRVWPRGALVSTTHATSRQEFSSGVGGSPATRDYHDNDSASDYNETLAGSDDDNCVITASLHIPAAFPQSQSQGPVTAPPRRRSTSSSSSAKRDSAVGSSSVSVSSSPPSSPPPAPLRVTVSTAGEIRTPADIDRLINLGRERNTSDARAVVLRQHDESKSVTKSGTTRTTSTRHEHNTRRHDHNTGMQELNTGRQELNTGRQELNKDLNTGRHDHHPGRIEHSSSRHRDLNTGRLEHSSSRHRDLHTGRIEHSSRPDYNPGRNEHMPGRSEQNSSRLESGIKESSSGRHSHTFGRQEPSSGRPDHDLGRLESAKDVSKKEENTVKRDVSSTTLYKRGELISSARTKSHHHNT